MRFCFFFTLSLFLHVSLFALLNQIHLPIKTPQSKPDSLTLDIQTIHIAPPPPPPHVVSQKSQPQPATIEPRVAPKPRTKPQPILQPKTTTLPVPLTQTEAIAPPHEAPKETQETLHVTPQMPVETTTLYEAIHRAIMHHKHYPKRAQREGMEGEVVVSFTYAKEGITHLKIKTPSKHALLNAYCLELIKEASAEFPHIDDSCEIIIPIGFFLR